MGLQQLGPPANGNAEFTTSVTQFVDNFSWLRGRHSMKLGGDWRIEHLDVLQPPSPTGSFQFTNILTANLSAAGTPVTGTGNSFASFLLGQVQNFTIDVQQEVLKPRAQIARVLLSGRLQGYRQADVEPRRSLYAELSIHGRRRPRRRFQSANPEARLSGEGWAARGPREIWKS